MKILLVVVVVGVIGAFLGFQMLLLGTPTMLSFFVFVLLCVIGVVICKKYSKKGKRKVANKYSGLADEVIQLLKMIQNFTNSPYWEEEAGLVMLIPVNAKGEMYRPNSDRIRVSVLLYRDDAKTINIFSQGQEIVNRFKLVREGNSYSYVADTWIYFNDKYKEVMPVINTRVRQAFPHVDFKFDGSRVMTNKLL